MDVFPHDEDRRVEGYAKRLRTLQKRPIYVDPESSASTTSLSPERPSKKRCTALSDITSTGANRERRPGDGRKIRTAIDARAFNTIRETVVLGPRSNQLFRPLQHHSHLNAHTTIRPVTTPANPNISVVIPPRDPL